MNVLTDDVVMAEAEDRTQPLPRAFGWQARLQLSCRRLAVLDDIDLMTAWCRQLVAEIGMQAYGPPIVDRFGEGDLLGVTAVQRMLVQRLTTSAIVVHADPPTHGLFLDVFSCQWFAPGIVANSARRFFDATAGTGDFDQRRTPVPDSGFHYRF